jgi:Mg-chelatase subunit ChlD
LQTEADVNTHLEERMKNRDYTLVIDKSGSMEEGDVPNFATRWAAIEETTKSIAAKLHRFDPDGITVCPFGSNFKRYDNVTPDTVGKIFKENEPGGSTAMHLVLKDCVDKFKQRKKDGKLKDGETIVVVTDGAPDSPQAVAQVIVEATKLVDDKNQLKFVFFQIGKDHGARAFLKKLDDELGPMGAKFDIVSAKTFEELENTTVTEAITAEMD